MPSNLTVSMHICKDNHEPVKASGEEHIAELTKSKNNVNYKNVANQ